MYQQQDFGSSVMGILDGEDWDQTKELSWKEFFRVTWDDCNSHHKRNVRHKLGKEPLWMSNDVIHVEHHLIKSASEAFSPSLIWECYKNKDLKKGSRIHDELQRRGLFDNKYSDALISMYAKCGELQKAQALLDAHSSKKIFPWNALMAGYARNNEGHKILASYEKMQCNGILPNKITYVCILKACALLGAFDKGKKIHDEISRQGLLSHDVVLSGALVNMYAKCGALQQAQSVLEQLPLRDVVCWNALITGYAQNGRGEQALECFQRMLSDGILPDEVTYTCILKACATIGAIDIGTKIHDEIMRQGLLQHDIVLSGAVVDMYAKCGALQQAQDALEKLPSRNVVCWNALITGYAQNGQGEKALECYEDMQLDGIHPDETTYVCILNACAAIQAIEEGRTIHGRILRQGLLEHHVVLGGALVDMYAKCGDLLHAQRALEKLPSRSVVSWGALIGGYAQTGQGQQALDCFEGMQKEGILPDDVTYGCILKACVATGDLDKGKKIHNELLRQGLLEHHTVLGGALVDMYAKCGALCLAQSVLQGLPSRDIMSWNALIIGYAQNGNGKLTLDCFEQMQHEGIFPNEVTYTHILKACGAVAAIEKGKKIHREISRQGFLECSIELGGALVDMYAKCGALHLAQNVLEKLPSRDIVSWNAVIAGYAQLGQSQHALGCFKQMQKDGIVPNEVTFGCLLNMCSHLGLVEKGQELFDSMEALHGLKPNVVNFTCMVDLLGRAGHLARAVNVIQGMPVLASSAIWHCLLSACEKWVDVDVGAWAFEKAIELDKCDVAAYLLMANVYGAAGMLEKAEDIEVMRIRNQAQKPYHLSSCGDTNNQAYRFCDEHTKQAGFFVNWNGMSGDILDAAKSSLLAHHAYKQTVT